MCVRSYFFFFKQKTAYAMRISDWSSDVGSSDLRCLLDELVLVLEPAIGDVVKRLRVLRFGLDVRHALLVRLQQFGIELRDAIRQIGRASCRESVRQPGRFRWSPYL